MTIILNTEKMKPIRGLLRNRQTEAEVKLWRRLNGRQVEGLRFCRQFSVGRYVLDFYCPTKHLCIELDGGQHANPEATCYDKARTKYLNSLRIKVIRFWNNEVYDNMEGVLETIRRAARDQGTK